MVLRSIKKLRSSSLLSKSTKKTSNVGAVITFKESNGQVVALEQESEVREDVVPAVEAQPRDVCEQDEREKNEEPTMQPSVDANWTASKESVVETSVAVDRKPPTTPRFREKWFLKDMPQKQPSIEVVSESETEIEVVAAEVAPVKKDAKMSRLRSFMKLPKSNRELPETPREVARKEEDLVTKTSMEEYPELSIKASVENVVEIVDADCNANCNNRRKLRVKQKSIGIQRMGSLKIQTLDDCAICADQSVKSAQDFKQVGDAVPSNDSNKFQREPSLTKSICSASARSSENGVTTDNASVPCGKEAEDSKPNDVSDPAQSETFPSVFTEIGSMFQRMGSCTRSISFTGLMMKRESSMPSAETAAEAIEAGVEENGDIKPAIDDLSSAVVNTTSKDFPVLNVSEDAASMANCTQLDALEIALNRSVSLEGVQSMAKSIVSALEVALEGTTAKQDKSETRAIADQTRDDTFEVALDGTSVVGPLVYQENPGISFEGAKNVADNTVASVKSMAETIFNALEVALKGTSMGEHLVCKKKESASVEEENLEVDLNSSCAPGVDIEEVSVKTQLVGDTSRMSLISKSHVGTRDSTPEASSLKDQRKQSMSTEDVNSSEDVIALGVANEEGSVSGGTDVDGTRSITERTHLSTNREAEVKTLGDDKIGVGSAVDTGEKSVKNSIDSIVNKAKYQLSDVDSNSIETASKSEKDNMDLFQMPASITQDVSHTKENALSTDETVGKALLDSILFNLAKAEVAAKSDGNTDKQVKVHLLRSKLLHLTNREDKWATQLEGTGVPDDVFIAGPIRGLLSPVLKCIENAANMIDRAMLDTNTACMISTAELIDHQCVDKSIVETKDDDLVNDQCSC